MPRSIAIAAALLVIFGVLEISSYEAKQHERSPAGVRPVLVQVQGGVLVRVHGGSVQDGIVIVRSYRVMLRAANRLGMGERVLASQIRVTEWSPGVMLISGPRRDALALAACYRAYVSHSVTSQG